MPKDLLAKQPRDLLEGSIYAKGGNYEQFGPNPPMFNPMPKKMAGMVETGASQPGSALPFVGQMVGSMVGSEGGPLGAAAGGVSGALAGEGARQDIGKKLGYQDNADSAKQFKAVGKSAALNEGLGLGLNAVTSIPGVKQAAGEAANSLMLNILKLPKKLGTRNLELGTEALRLGITGSRDSMLDKAENVISSRSQQIEDAINSNPTAPIRKNIVANKLDQLSKFYDENKAPNLAEKARSQSSLFMNDFEQPETSIEKEERRFIIPQGTEGKLTYPELIKKENYEPTGFVIPQGSDSKLTYPSASVKLAKDQGKTFFDGSTNTEIPIERKLRVNEIPITETSGSPGYESRTARQLPSKSSIIPVTKTLGHPEDIVGGYVPPAEKQVTRMVPKNMSIAEAQLKKKGQYDLITNHLKPGAYNADANPAELATRMKYAQGLKEGIEEALPQHPIKSLNSDIGNAETIKDALSDEAARNARLNYMNLEDTLLTGGGLIEPKLLAFEIAKKASRSAPVQTGLAKALYGYSNRPAYAQSARRYIYPGISALSSSAGRKMSEN